MSDNNLTTEEKLQLIRKISALADGVTLEFIKGLSDTINNPDAEESEKLKAFSEIDKVLRIAKQYSERVLLAEGKNTENIGINGNGGGFNVTFIETVAAPKMDTDDDDDKQKVNE